MKDISGNLMATASMTETRKHIITKAMADIGKAITKVTTSKTMIQELIHITMKISDMLLAKKDHSTKNTRQKGRIILTSNTQVRNSKRIHQCDITRMHPTEQSRLTINNIRINIMNLTKDFKTNLGRTQIITHSNKVNKTTKFRDQIPKRMNIKKKFQ